MSDLGAVKNIEQFQLPQSGAAVNLLNYDLMSLQQLFKLWQEPSFRAQQLSQWIHREGIFDFDLMSNLSKNLRAKLRAEAEIGLPDTIYRQQSNDGTYKWLLRLKDGNSIETVFIPEPGRGTLCISSQVGCALNCSFCSTAKEGFNRNLSTSEIIGQLAVAKRDLKFLSSDFKITNVVMMGMGEPLLNYQALIPALNLMLSDYSYGLSKYRVTVSTAGVIPGLLQLKKDSPVALAVSLHAPTNSLRDQLVPLNKKYPLEELIPVCKEYYSSKSKRRVTFEYVMLKEINDSLDHAAQLAQLLKSFPCKLNLIPFNPFSKTHYQTSSESAVSAFQNFLVNSGVPTWVRKTRGQDISAACGQLAGEFKDKTGRHQRWKRTGKLVPIGNSVGSEKVKS